MPLTDTAIKQAKPKAKPYKLADEKGLYLLVNTGGSKLWRFKYRVNGKEKLLALGAYPDVPLAGRKDSESGRRIRGARDLRDEARSLLADGIDPSEYRQDEKRGRAEAAANSFKAVALDWMGKQAGKWTEGYAEHVKRLFERDLFPWLGKRPLAELKAPELLATLRRIEGRGAIETAHRANQLSGQVFRFAIASGLAERDISADLRGALQPVKKGHFAALTDPSAVGELMRAIDGYQGSFTTLCALKLAPIVFQRPGELRRMEWAELDLDAAEWRIPAAKMKKRVDHIVPLPRQVVEILQELMPLTGNRRYVFPGERSPLRPMSENTVLGALRRLGYQKGQMTGHGFRAMARTLLAEQGWNPEAIERQLAHKPAGPLGSAYDRTQYLAERRKMMQAWADYLDALKRSERVVPIRRSA